MRKILLLAGGLAFSLFLMSQELRNPDIVVGQLIKILPSLKDLKPDPSFNPRVTRDITGLIAKKTWKDDVRDFGTKAKGDPVVQKESLRSSEMLNNEAPNVGTVITQNFDGMGFTNVSPADPVVAAGPNHIIQMINGSQGAYFRVWNKIGGNMVAQTYLYQLFATPGYSGAGDPIVLYDQFADRYVLSEFGFTGGVTSYVNTLIIAVSQTNDPAGGWYIYKFIDNTFYVDYPHYSAWPDAFYATSNDFNTAGNSYLGSSVYAFEKAKMLVGNATASMQKFRLTSSQYTKFFSLAPVNISGPTPPAAGSPGMFFYYHDDNRTATTTDVDSVGIITLNPDFVTPANTVLTFAQQMLVAPFKASVCGSRNCVPSGGASGYDAISDRFMNKIYYRNFGTHEAIVATHTVDASYPALPANSGLRWYEFRRSGVLWSPFQQSTYSPDGDGRWMASININSKGQIALAYNSSAAGKFASIFFTGRNSYDPLNKMVYDESELKKGDAYGTFANRWGDYNDLVTDPSNDSIFWFTAMYGSTNWKTRVSAFKLEVLPLLDARLVAIISPTDGFAQCETTVTPIVTIRNAGSSTLTSLNINVQVDSGPITTTAWTGSLELTQSANVTLPTFTSTPGSHTLKVFTSEPNGSTDENKINDTSSINFTILSPVVGPIVESFESITFAPPGWRVINPNAGSITWERTTLAGKSGSASARIRLYDYTTSGHLDFLLSPILDVSEADSILLSFERAYRLYSATLTDSLEIVVSKDCGNTFTTAWKKGGAQLATVAGTQASAFIPTATQWLKETIDLKAFVGTSTSVNVGFKSINRFGQNLYLDDINIKVYKLPRRDAYVRNVIEPFSRLCTRSFLPVVQIGSLGKDTLRSVKILYRVNNNPLDSVLWTGTMLNGQFVTVNLKTITLTSGGNYLFTVYTKEPNGLPDENPENDTAKVNFIVFDPQPAPVKEGFEQPTFPPANWSVGSSGTGFTWERTTRASSEKAASAWIRNYRFNSNGKRDDLFSPLVQLGTLDSLYLSFDLAHATGNFPGSTGVPLDTLEVLVTFDCGKTYRSVYKKWGEELQTVGSPNFPWPGTNDTIGFVPNASRHWRSEFLDITKWVPNNSRFQVVFRNTSNKGNNTFLDNINISTINLPARLKQNGYMILPNPFDGWFAIRHLLPPVNLKGIQVSNAAGQVIYDRSFNGNASSYLQIDLSRYATGVYQVKLLYDTKVITERLVKRK